MHNFFKLLLEVLQQFMSEKNEYKENKSFKWINNLLLNLIKTSKLLLSLLFYCSLIAILFRYTLPALNFNFIC